MEAILKRDSTEMLLSWNLSSLLRKKVAAAKKAKIIHSYYFSPSFGVFSPFHIPCERSLYKAPEKH